jgi:tetratricopeptide (TPR) repeat protein
MAVDRGADEDQISKASQDAIAFFQRPPALPKEVLLSLLGDLLDVGLMLFAPLGLPRDLRSAWPSEAAFLAVYEPRFRAILDSASAAVYEAKGVSEGQVAMSIFRCVEEERDADAAEAVHKMGQALRQVYCPAPVLELPLTPIPIEDMAQFARQIRDEGAIYQAAADANPESRSRVLRNTLYPHVFAALGLILDSEEQGWCVPMPGLMEGAESGGSKEAVRRSVTALQSIRSGRSWEFFRQDQLQALVESAPTNPSVESVSSQSFSSDPVFSLVSQLRMRLRLPESNGGESEQAPSDRLDSLHRAVMAEDSALERRGRGDNVGACEMFGNAFAAAYDVSGPDPYVARQLGEQALSLVAARDAIMTQRAWSRAEAALGLDPLCLPAYIARGELRLAGGDSEGAMHDLVRALVLDSGPDPVITRAEIIEQAARDSCAERAREEFFSRSIFGSRELHSLETQQGSALPPAWLIHSYFRGFEGEIDGTSLNWLETEEAGIIDGALKQLVTKALDARRVGDHQTCAEAFARAAPYISRGTSEQVSGAILGQHGSYVYLAGDMQRGLSILRDASSCAPKDVRLMVKIGGVLSDLDMKEEAKEWFDMAEEAGPTFSEVFLHRGQYKLLSGDLNGAVQDLERGAQESPSGTALATWGVALFKLEVTSGQQYGVSSRAVRILRSAWQEHPNCLEAKLFYSEVLTHLGDFATALSVLSEAASCDPSCPIPYVNAARAYLSMNDTRSARIHLDRALAIDDKCSAVYLDMGQLMMQDGAPEKALGFYRMGVSVARYLTELHDALTCLTIAQAHISAKRCFKNMRKGGLCERKL